MDWLLFKTKSRNSLEFFLGQSLKAEWAWAVQENSVISLGQGLARDNHQPRVQIRI